ncbi:GNAT family N-acetyltransferase [Actinotalea sp. K2]|uniref:GNAT family N-acetyltransferase n=1 Tax=Actinotalea sp. K2 TaxID=2939438 RepID=UPI002016AEE8|nr:GNAT family N-acetyltransferase [Actinotalea sp. K2]MCL3861106.1 GNAT family N-acetyltransferase [Actinotalea sp. K2]
MPVAFHRSETRAIDPLTLYAILRLRVDVFIVEQACPYPDVDGRDVEPGAELHWATDGSDVLATLRVLHEADGALRVGRVATGRAARSRGVASRLMREALDRCDALDASAPVLLDAQAHLVEWYARFGFEVAGDGFDEDGIPHLPMRLRR